MSSPTSNCKQLSFFSLVIFLIKSCFSQVLLQETLPELGSLTSGVVLLLLVNLRHCLLIKQKEVKFGPTKDRLGNSNMGMSDNVNTYHTPSLQANTATLKVILSNIVEWLLKSGNIFPVIFSKIQFL